MLKNKRNKRIGQQNTEQLEQRFQTKHRDEEMGTYRPNRIESPNHVSKNRTDSNSPTRYGRKNRVQVDPCNSYRNGNGLEKRHFREAARITRNFGH